MAVLQKIRNRGAFLVGVVGLALFAFIAEEAVRSFQSTANENRQKVGEVLGESLSLQEYNAMIDEYAEFEKASRGTTQLDEQAMYSVRERAWGAYVQNSIIKHECDQVGLTVTDAELQDVVVKGNSQWLMQFARMLGMNGYDYTVVRQIVDQYNSMVGSGTSASSAEFEQIKTVYNLWQFVEKRVREDVLTQKFVSLLQTTVGNDVAAKAAFDDRVNQYDVVLAALPYTSIADETVEVSDKDIKDKYNEMKPLFKNDEEMRSVEVISVKVVASEADREALRSDLLEVAASIGEATNLSKAVREAGSNVAYSPLPVSRRRLPGDIAACVDSMAVGQIAGPFTSPDNTMNVVRLVNKVNVPDSVEYRQIVVGGADIAAARKTADSIVAAINQGAPFDTIAAQKNQQGATAWLTGAQYEGQAITGDNLKYITAINECPKGTLQVVELGNICIVLNVTDRRAFTDKYDVAIVKRAINFSKETYTAEYNRLSQFLAENQTAAAIRENAPAKNYALQTYDVTGTSANVAGVASTRNTLRWIMDEDTKKDAVSELFECGENDNLMVCILKDITPKGYFPADNQNVNPGLRAEVLKDKKAEKLIADMAGKSLDEVAKMQGARVDTLSHVSFAGNVYVPAIGASERSIAGALVGKKAGDLVQAVKGDAAVYTILVNAVSTTAETFNADNERDRAAMNGTQMAMQGLMQRLLEKADITDHRYIFY